MTQTGIKVIRKYANRKLYDCETSKYTTLKAIVGEVTGGRDVQIVDNVSKEDITVTTLLQAIVETDDGKTQAGTLSGIIRAGGLTKYLAGLTDSKPTQVG